MKFADNAEVEGITNIEENLNFVQQLVTSNKTTLKPSFQGLVWKNFLVIRK